MPIRPHGVLPNSAGDPEKSRTTAPRGGSTSPGMTNVSPVRVDARPIQADLDQTCFTTSEAGKRTFFWEAYLSSAAR
jgi:hypothetical protein